MKLNLENSKRPRIEFKESFSISERFESLGWHP